jgi:CysZ protein
VIINDFLRALWQFRDPRFRHVIWLGIGLSLALLVAIYTVVLLCIQALMSNPIELPVVGAVTGLGTLLSIGSLFVMLALSVFLMAPVASAFTGLFLDDIATAVEEQHYPGLPAARKTPIGEALVESARYFTVLIVLNLFALVVFIFTGPIGLFLFWAINGYLLGREYFNMVATRRLPSEQAYALRRENWFKVWVAGALMAVPLSVPLLNLVIPVLGVATFTHLFHRVVAHR